MLGKGQESVSSRLCAQISTLFRPIDPLIGVTQAVIRSGGPHLGDDHGRSMKYV
jgi:hypothetical protein